MLPEKLQHIHENLCFGSGIRPSKPYKGIRPINFTNKKIQSCQDCGGKFSLEDGSAELTCLKCGRIEILDGTAFAMRKTYNARTTTRKYTFKYKLQKLLDSCYYPTKLYPFQIDEACVLYFRTYTRQTTKTNMLSLCDLQNPRKDYTKRATTHDSKIYTNKNIGFHTSKTRTNME